jgi:hypothetical protein
MNAKCPIGLGRTDDIHAGNGRRGLAADLSQLASEPRWGRLRRGTDSHAIAEGISARADIVSTLAMRPNVLPLSREPRVNAASTWPCAGCGSSAAAACSPASSSGARAVAAQGCRGACLRR